MLDATNSLSVQLLGPLRVWFRDEELIIGPPKQRALLALLATHQGAVVRREQIIDGLWGTEAPSTAVNGVHTYIAGLRRVLDPVRGRRESGEVLVSRLGGYELQLPVDAVDALLFVRQREEARQMAAAGRSDDAFERLGMALGLWQGDALAGVPGPFAALERSRLREMRFTDVEEWTGGMIATGRSEEAIVVLNEAIIQEPLREKLRYLLMLALYLCGRQAHALHVYSDTRAYLDEELGITPGAELRDLHSRILMGTVESEGTGRIRPSRLAPTRGSEATRGSESGGLPSSSDCMPSHLPSRASIFVGRAAELAAVRVMLTQDNPERGRATPILAIDGAPGVGKSALALELAHESLDRFPDGQLYVDLGGTGDSPLSAFDALAQLLLSLGIERTSLPTDLAGRVLLYRSLLHGRQMLVVLDDVLDADQLRPLIPQGSACLIVTSRQSQRALVVRYGAHRIRLKPLDPETAADLLLRLTGAEYGQERPCAIDRLVELCGYFPLAIRITAGTLLGDLYGSPERLVAQYEDPAVRLDLLAVDGDEELSVRAMFTASYRKLSDEAARMLRLLCAAGLEEIGLLPCLRLMGTSVTAVTECLESLVNHGLLERVGPERYGLNGLVRIYGAERAEAQSEAIRLPTPRQLTSGQGVEGRRIGGRMR